MRKLVLRPEALTELTTDEMTQVVGAAVTNLCNTYNVCVPDLTNQPRCF